MEACGPTGLTTAHLLSQRLPEPLWAETGRTKARTGHRLGGEGACGEGLASHPRQRDWLLLGQAGRPFHPSTLMCGGWAPRGESRKSGMTARARHPILGLLLVSGATAPGSVLRAEAGREHATHHPRRHHALGKEARGEDPGWRRVGVARALCSSNPDTPGGAAPGTPGPARSSQKLAIHGWRALAVPPEPRRGALTWTPGPTACEAWAVGTAVCGGTWGCTCGCCTTIGARTCGGRSSDLQLPGQGWGALAASRRGAPAASLADVCYQSTLTRGSSAVPTPAWL